MTCLGADRLSLLIAILPGRLDSSFILPLGAYGQKLKCNWHKVSVLSGLAGEAFQEAAGCRGAA